MRKTLFPFCVFMMALTAAADSQSITPNPVTITFNDSAPFSKDRVIVKMKTKATSKMSAVDAKLSVESSFEKAAVASGLTFQRTLADNTASLNAGQSSLALMQINTANDNVEAAITRLMNEPDIEFAQPDFVYHISAVPNDPSYGSLWGLKNTAQTITSLHLTHALNAANNPGTAGKDMDLETAWNTITDCSNVVVAVIDSGVKLDHSDLTANLWSNASLEHGYDFVNSDTNPTDDNGHGTHVAGTIGARGDNGIGTTGVCWKVQLMAVKVMDASGSGYSSDIIDGINFARVNGAHIINMSLGGSAFDQLTFNALKTASDNGILSVVAAGNAGQSTGSAPVYPCNYEIANILCVGAVDQKFATASFSNYSTTFVDIGAPGTNIISAGLNEWGAPINVPLAAIDWTLSNANFAFSGGYLQNPALWNGSSVNYANSSDDVAYTSVDMSGTSGGVMKIGVRGASQTYVDYLSVYESAAAGDPTSLVGNRIARLSGSTAGSLVYGNITMSTCPGSATCTVGLRFTSDAATTGLGFRIQSLDIDTKVTSTTGLEGMDGTSMATPHVAGLAALIKARTPAFTAADIKSAILTSGTTVSSLATKFKSSSVVNAPAALKAVDTPAGVSAAVVP